jgi:hypothetical protein
MDFFLIYTSKNDRKTYIDASAYPAHPNKHTKAQVTTVQLASFHRTAVATIEDRTTTELSPS